MKHRLELGVAIRLLQQRQGEIVEQLRATKSDPQWLEAKRQIDRAIQCLTFCEAHQIHPDAEVVKLPWPRDAFGSFLVVDVDEMGSPSSWRPARAGGQAVTLGAGDVVIRAGNSFNLPPGDPSKSPA